MKTMFVDIAGDYSSRHRQTSVHAIQNVRYVIVVVRNSRSHEDWPIRVWVYGI